jgi:uncharacterized protein
VKDKGVLDPGDIEEAAGRETVGDDKYSAAGNRPRHARLIYARHSEQRLRWFRQGFETGDIGQGDTFSASSL